MSVTGTWKNSYGSVMSLVQSFGGAVSGTYQSTTGSSGTFLVAGFANPNAATSSRGEDLSLSIFWRSINGGKGDPSWHWVSGLSGQKLAASGSDTPATLNLIHAMVATDDFPGQASVGTYLDKLIYLPDPLASTGAGESASDRGTAGIVTGGNPILGTWLCQEDSTLTLTFAEVNPGSGQVQGSLALSGDAQEIVGFTDPYAQQSGLSLQGTSVSTFLSSSGRSMVLAGSLDYGTGALTLTQLLSQGTASDQTYVQTRGATLTFLQQP